MICVICKHGETQQGTETVTLERDGMTIVIKNVPAQVCQNCGEAYIDEAITRHLLQQAEQAAQSGIQVSISQYVAA